MNFHILTKVIDELSLLLCGARAERVYEGAGKGIFITFRNAGKNLTLLISPDRSLPRLHLVMKKPSAALSLHPFTQYLKSRAAGSRIAGISLLNWDRIVEIRFSRQGPEYRLIIEFIGSASNLIITDPDGIVLAAYYPVPPAEGHLRPVIPGIRYELPPKKAFHTRETVLDPEKDSRMVLERQAEIAPQNREAEIYYDRLLERRRLESARNGLRALVKKMHAKAVRRWEAISSDQKAADNAEEYKQAGDLILANLNKLRTGMKQAELESYDGVSVLVSLDSGQSPKRNAERYFKKYKKAKSGCGIIAARLQEAREEMSFLQMLLFDLEKADDEPGILAVRSKLAEKGYLRLDPTKRKPRSAPRSSSYRKIQYCGWEIIIGKSAAGNDHITTKIAADRDLWLHAEGLPGSHVIVRDPESKGVPDEVLEKAASVAAFYSKGRTAGKVPVTYTLARNVKKPKGAKPGLVTVSERKTIMAVPREE